MDILDDMGVSKLSAKVFFKVNYSVSQHFFKTKPYRRKFLGLGSVFHQ